MKWKTNEEMNIGRRLAIVRQSRGLTIKDVTSKGITNSYDRIETGKINVSFAVLLEICEILQIDIWDLVAEELIVKYKEK